MEYCHHFINCSLTMLHDHPFFGILYPFASVMFSLKALLGNVIVFYSFWIASSMSRTTKLLFFSLAASDLCVGFLVHPLNAAMMADMSRLAINSDGANDDQSMTLSCRLLTMRLFFAIFFGGVSLLTVAAISIDRYLALSLHLRYAQLVTPRRIRVAIVAIWVASFMGALLQSVLHFSPIAIMSCVLFALIVASFAYFKIFRIAFHHQNQICVADWQHNQICRLTHFARARKLAMKTMYIYVILIICYAPSLFIYPAFTMSNSPPPSLTLSYYLASFLSLYNSVLNPLVYCWKISEVRETVVDVMKRIFSKCIPLARQ